MVCCSPASASATAQHCSRFASLYPPIPIDPYTFAVSDPYQTGWVRFTGKGIFDVDTFAQILCERIPENRVLPRPLEGGFLRTDSIRC